MVSTRSRAGPTRLLTRSDVAGLIDMPATIEAVEAALIAHARGQTQMPPKVYLEFPEYGGDLRAMPARVGDVAGVKWINSHPHNPQRFRLPTVRGVFLLSDPATANLLAVMDATLITALRTGASAGIATRALARPGRFSLGFVGAGAQARHLLAAVRAARPDDVSRVLVYDRDGEAARAFAADAGGEVASLQTTAGCDVLVTVTPSRTPIVRREWLAPGAHVNAMGADAHGKQELESDVLRHARVFVDDLVQASGSGEVNVPLERGELRREDIAGTLGEVLAGSIEGRHGADEVTVFDSTGLAIQDAAVAALVFERAEARGVGLELDIFG